MATTRSFGNHQNQSATNYINKKGIHELFEALMTALMVNKPDDHIGFIRECLDKVQNNPQRLRWDFFVTTTPASNSKGALSTRPSLVKNRQKVLPPVRTSNSTTPKTIQKSDSRTTKPTALPPIENQQKSTLNPPIVFILSSTNSTKLCSKLLERYNQINYFYINDLANIDENLQSLDWKNYEHRFDRIAHEIEQHRSNARGFLLRGHLDERNFGQNWLEKLERIDLMILLSTHRQAIFNQNLKMIYIDSTNDFDTILAKAIHEIDQIFPLNTLSSESMNIKSNHFNLPIIFCIDNHRLIHEEHPSDETQHSDYQRTSIDQEFDLVVNENVDEEENNNSFISTLCERLSEQLSYKHIHCGESHRILMNFEQLKTLIIESMSTSTGFIIDHFPTSLDDLKKFQNEIGPCSVLIYIGEHQTEMKDDEFNVIIEQFKQENKAIYIDCRMEVDEIYEDLHKDILKHI